MKPLLIGQAPGPSTDPDFPLHPAPRSSSGGRLASIMGLSDEEYLEAFDRVNLLRYFPGRHRRDDKFPPHLGRVAAGAIAPFLRGRVVVAVGRNVSLSFGGLLCAVGFHEWVNDPGLGARVAVVPHPSGRNHWYNLEENISEARSFWKKFLAEGRF